MSLFPYSSTRYLTNILRPGLGTEEEEKEEDSEYTLFLLEKYVSHLGTVLQRMIVNNRALREHLAQGTTVFLLAAPTNSRKEVLFLLNHAPLDTLVEPWLGLVQTPSTRRRRTPLSTLVAHPDFRHRLQTEIRHIFHKVQNFVQNKRHHLLDVVTLDSAVYTLHAHVEVYASATI